MDYNIDELEWKCLDCGMTAAPTNYDYMKLLKHQKGHYVRLVNKATREVVALCPIGARSKGIEIPSMKRTALACSKPVLDLRLNYDKSIHAQVSDIFLTWHVLNYLSRQNGSGLMSTGQS